MSHLRKGEFGRMTSARARRSHLSVTELYHGLSMASKTPTALGQAQRWGRIEVFPSAVAAIAGHAALSCYGVTGMAARGLRDGVAELLRRERVDRGVEGVEVEGGLAVNLFAIVQYVIGIF